MARLGRGQNQASLPAEGIPSKLLSNSTDSKDRTSQAGIREMEGMREQREATPYRGEIAPTQFFR